MMVLEKLSREMDLREHLKRFVSGNILGKIYDALPSGQKEEFVKYREKWVECDRDRIDLAFPLCISLELVANCNLKCSHCARNIPEWREKAPSLFSNMHMGFSTFKKIVDECAAEHLPSLWLGCSGEALLEKDIVKMARYAHESGIIDLILTTNGTLLTEEIIDQLFAIPITRINISVDAFTKETYDEVRGGEFDKLISNIEYIIKNRKDLPVVRLTFIDLPQNRHEKEKFVEYWKPSVDLVDIQNYIDLHDNDVKENVDFFHCSAPWRIIDIQADGSLVPCNSFFAIPDLVMGNIHEQSIGEIWNSNKFRVFRSNLKSGKHTDSCKKCFSS